MDPGKKQRSSTGLTEKGYPINYGTSFLMVLGFEEDGPKAKAIMTYSASSDPESSNFIDQTQLWSQKKLRPVLFTEADIKADSAYREQRITAPRKP